VKGILIPRYNLCKNREKVFEKSGVRNLIRIFVNSKVGYYEEILFVACFMF